MLRSLLTFAVLAGVSHAAQAEWKPKAELGIVNTTGNSETTSVNGKFALRGEDQLWTHDHYLAALRAESSDELSANRFELGAKTARKFGERRYAGVASRYENDDFSAYDYQATLAMNFGYWAIRKEGRNLRLEGGPGLRRARLAATGETEDDALLRGYADYQHQITDSTQFFNTLLVEAGADNRFLQNDIGIAVNINKSLALKAALQARHNTEAPVGGERTDTLTSVNVVWSPRTKAK